MCVHVGLKTTFKYLYRRNLMYVGTIFCVLVIWDICFACYLHQMVSDWQTRFSARLNMSLTCLRNQTDLLTVRTTLHILSMIYRSALSLSLPLYHPWSPLSCPSSLPPSNAQEYDDEHSYRCVRVTSSLFARHVWCFPEAQQFLLQSGWIEVPRIEIDSFFWASNAIHFSRLTSTFLFHSDLIWI